MKKKNRVIIVFVLLLLFISSVSTWFYFYSKEKIRITKELKSQNLKVMLKENPFCAYSSINKYPVMTNLEVFNTVPNVDEYNKYLDSLPWEIPHGKGSLKWVPDKVNPCIGKLTSLNRDLKTFRTFEIGYPNSYPFSNYFTKNYNVTNQDFIDYLRFKFVKELLACGVESYKMLHDGQYPDDIETVEGLLGLKLKKGYKYADFGVIISYSGIKPIISYRNSKLPKDLTKASVLEPSRWISNKPQNSSKATVALNSFVTRLGFPSMIKKHSIGFSWP